MSMQELYGLLPNYDQLGELAQQAQEINSYAAQGQITAEEQRALLEDLVRTQLIIDEANWHEQKLFFNQVIDVLMKMPIP